MTKKKPDTLESLIDQKFHDLLEQSEAQDGEGKPLMTRAQLTTALVGAIRWVAVKRKIEEGDGFGTALREGGTYDGDG